MTTYSIGTKLFCDYHFGGKPKAVCVEVVKPGNGKDQAGEIRAKLTETVGAYRKGEIVTISTYYEELAEDCANQIGELCWQSQP